MVGSGSTARRASRGPLARGSTLPASPHPTLAHHPGADRGRIRRPVVGTHSSGPRHLREPRVLGSGRFTRVDDGRQRCETLGRRGGIIFPLMGREPIFSVSDAPINGSRSDTPILPPHIPRNTGHVISSEVSGRGISVLRRHDIEERRGHPRFSLASPLRDLARQGWYGVGLMTYGRWSASRIGRV